MVKVRFCAINATRVAIYHLAGLLCSFFQCLTQITSASTICCRNIPVRLRLVLYFGRNVAAFLVIYVAANLNIEINLLLFRRTLVRLCDGIFCWFERPAIGYLNILFL